MAYYLQLRVCKVAKFLNKNLYILNFSVFQQLAQI